MIAPEPLAVAIRLHTDIKGVPVEGTKNKAGLYADDILLFLSFSEMSILVQLYVSGS